MRSNFSCVGVHNSNIYLAAPIPISPKLRVSMISHFCMLNGARRILCVALWVVFECGIATIAISLYLPLSHQYLAIPLDIV